VKASPAVKEFGSATCFDAVQKGKPRRSICWYGPHRFEFEDRRYSAFSIMDISHEKRRRALERIFFHDILNIAGGMQTYLEFMVYKDSHFGPNELNTINRHVLKTR